MKHGIRLVLLLCGALFTLAVPPAFTAEAGKTLVVFFSHTGENYNVGFIEKGNTAIIAGMIAAKTGADSFELKPLRPYPTKYKACTDVAKKERNDHARPEYAGDVDNLTQYDRVFIGAPVWWGDWPMIVYTFLEKNDLSGKTLIPFCTHEGSGLSGFGAKLSAAAPGAKVLDGLAVTGRVAQKDREAADKAVTVWLQGLGK
ncbi:MAG: flavodoxin [Deltaproteobacteria bacterium]|nr:flavodoxin [Deltaproteobacteria bacterium]